MIQGIQSKLNDLDALGEISAQLHRDFARVHSRVKMVSVTTKLFPSKVAALRGAADAVEDMLVCIVEACSKAIDAIEGEHNAR